MKKGRKRKRGRRKVYCRELLPHLRFLSGRVSSPSMQVISREKERGCKGVGRGVGGRREGEWSGIQLQTQHTVSGTAITLLLSVCY